MYNFMNVDFFFSQLGGGDMAWGSVALAFRDIIFLDQEETGRPKFF